MADKEMATIDDSRKVGRPCKYETHVLSRLDEIYEWQKAGYTDDSISENLGIGYSTWMKYKAENIELQEILTRARLHKSNLVMNAQYEKAKGIEKTVPKAFKIKEVKYDDKGKKVAEIERLEYADEYIYIPPDVNAADLVLRNIDPGYKQAKQVESGQNITVNFQLPEAKAKVEQLLTERQKAKAIDITGFEVVEAD